MRYLAIFYSILFGGIALWAWIDFFVNRTSLKEHLLPLTVLNVITMPSSLVMEKIVVMSPRILESPISMLALVTALGVFQVSLVWLVAARREP